MAKRKRIVICADGTWADPEDENPTNVLKIARAIRPNATDGTRQIVFYDWGVGSYYAKLRGGAAGVGLEKNVQDGYRFIVQNYHPGDEIYLFGFSRGAYTVRCLAGMLNNCGVLKRTSADLIPKAFRFYKKRSSKPRSTAATQWRKKHAVKGQRGAVDFIGVWDTVGALGIPTRALMFVEERDLFYDPVVGSNVQHARHAVSIDERRSDFKPTLWKQNEGVDVKQVWFAGVHADVGGGYAPHKGKLLSDIPLAWMAREANKAGIQFEPHLVTKSSLDPTARAHRSYKLHWRVLGDRVRKIHPEAVVHESVKKRFEATGYDPVSLRDWLAAHDGTWGPLES